ncbi:hypothetical protein BJX70DRAFT_358447 [Aspergillus crustosus]
MYCLRATKLTDDSDSTESSLNPDTINQPILDLTNPESNPESDSESESGPDSDDDEDENENEDEISIIDLQMFLSQSQPDDVTRHKHTLLELAPRKTWSEEDLEKEEHLKLGMRLLYNKINGLELLHLTKSIHIQYKQFPQAMINEMCRLREASRENKKKARKQGL